MGVLRVLHRRADEGTEGRERGSILVLFSLLLTLFLLCCAIVIDVGYWWANAKKAQIAADACALAAAQSIPVVDPTAGAVDPVTDEVLDKGECVIEDGGPDWVLTNIPVQGDESPDPLHTLTLVEWPYKKGEPDEDPTMVEAIVRMKVSTFFGRIVGHGGITVTRRAVAEKLPVVVSNLAIHSHSDDCNDSMTFDGHEHFVNGLVETNGLFRVNNGPFWAADGTIYRTPTDGCPSSIDESALAQFGEDMPDPDIPESWGTACGGSPCREPRDLLEKQPWPAWHVPAQFDCAANGIREKWEFTANDATLSGTYCATKSISVSGENNTGNVTFLAPEITIQKFGHTFTPYERNVLFFSLANDLTSPADDGPPPSPVACSNTAPMTLNADRVHWTGMIFHPCGYVIVNAAETTAGSEQLRGSIVALRVRIDGQGFRMIGTGPSGSNDALLALVE
jgi:hypothetical protein